MWENFADSSIYYRKTNHQQCSRNNHSKTERLVAKLFGEWKILSKVFIWGKYFVPSQSWAAPGVHRSSRTICWWKTRVCFKNIWKWVNIVVLSYKRILFPVGWWSCFNQLSIYLNLKITRYLTALKCYTQHIFPQLLLWWINLVLKGHFVQISLTKMW